MDGGAQFKYLFLGSNYAGFTINFYSAGTLTNKYVWVDESKSSGIYQVRADAYGMAIWYADGDYRMIIKDADGTLMWDWPFVKITSDTGTMWEGNYGLSYPTASSTNIWQSFVKHDASNNFLELGFNNGNEFLAINKQSINVDWLGAKGDGITDDSSIFQTANDNYQFITGTPGKIYKIASKVTLSGERLLSFYGCQLYGDTALASDYMFEASDKQRIFFKGGQTKLKGAKGLVNFTDGCYNLYLDDLRITDADNSTGGTIFTRIQNGFHLHMKNVVFAGASMTGKYFEAVGDTGEAGFTVVNNISLDDCSFSSEQATTLLNFDSSSGAGMNAILLNNCTIQGGGSQIKVTNGSADFIMSIRDTHFEDNSLLNVTSLDVTTGSAPVKITFDTNSVKNIDYIFDLDSTSTSSTLSLINNRFSGGSSDNLFAENDFIVTVHDNQRTAGYTWAAPASGTGIIQHLYPHTVAKT